MASSTSRSPGAGIPTVCGCSDPNRTTTGPSGSRTSSTGRCPLMIGDPCTRNNQRNNQRNNRRLHDQQTAGWPKIRK
jgi:hypothetical protein